MMWKFDLYQSPLLYAGSNSQCNACKIEQEIGTMDSQLIGGKGPEKVTLLPHSNETPMDSGEKEKECQNSD